ncbi:F-box domain-containing protein [Pleurotus pulmonarius]
MSGPSITQTSKLFDFSIEVLENIFQHLDSLHLLRVGLLSRQAHTFLLPYYFRRCNLKYSDDLTTVNHLNFNRDKMALTEDAFRAIRTSPLVTKVKHLHCIFSFPEHQFLWEIRNVYTVLLKLQHVEKIELDFAAIPNHLISHHGGRLKTLQEWRCAFRTFMQAVLDKSPSSLSVLYPPDGLLDPPHSVDTRGQLQVGFWRKLVPWTRLLPRQRPITISKRSLLDHVIPSAIRRSVHPSTSLESITSLQLGANIRQEGWGILTSHFTLPSLTSLDLDMRSQMGFIVTLRFLQRHPTISIFCLTNANAEETYAYRPYVIPDTFLPHLQTLKASLDVVLVFFGPHSTAKFGHLETVEVSEELDLPPSPDWESMARRLSRVAFRLAGKDITLHLSELQRNLFPTQPCTILSDLQIKDLRLCILGVAARSYDIVPWISSFTHLERLSIRSRDSPEHALWSANAKFADAVYKQHPKLHTVTVEGQPIPDPSLDEHTHSVFPGNGTSTT